MQAAVRRAIDRRRACRTRRAAGGQATVLVLGFAAALAGVLLVAYGTGERVAAKQRLLNAADAAAFGGAVWQARTLNFQAYANRAIVANEVALAQAVSLRSWSDYLGRALTNVDTVARYVPYLGQATTAAQQGWAAVDAALQPSMQAAELASIAVNEILAAAQPAVHGFGIAAAEEVARATLAHYGPGIRASTAAPALLARNAAEWQRLTTTYSGGQRARLRDVVMRGRDGFTRDRGARFSPGPVGVVFRLEKRGGTELVGLDTWRGLDTLALHRRQLFSGWRELTPLGWGAAQNAQRPALQRGDHAGAWRTNPRTARLADARLGSMRTRTYPGLPDTRDVARPERRDERELRFVIEAADRASDPIADAAGLGVTALAHARGTVTFHSPSPDAAQYALASAVVGFERPEPRADRRREFASLYSPYWFARLAAPRAEDRTLAAASRGYADPYAGIAP